MLLDWSEADSDKKIAAIRKRTNFETDPRLRKGIPGRRHQSDDFYFIYEYILAFSMHVHACIILYKICIKYIYIFNLII